MKKLLPLICLLVLFVSGTLTAQPPCLPIAGGIPAGNDAPGCTLCGPVYQGSTQQYGPSAPGSNGFPCGTIENNQFISITADASGTLQATIIASNCQNNQGVQLIIYDEQFNPVSNCFSSGGANLPGNVTAGGLIPGQTYWIMIDGFAGDICDILITTSGGVNTGPPDPPGPMTSNPDTTPLCPGAVVCYSIDDVNGATEYEWIPPGNAVIVSGGGPNDTQVCLEYISAGGGVVRVTPSNPCFAGVPAITPVVVVPILPTIKPPEAICLSDFPISRDGNIFNEPGNHQVTYKTGLGCDSVVTYLFIPNVQIPNVLDTTICVGDCVMVGFDCYDEPITQTITLGAPFQQENGCDSIVILTIEIFEPVAIVAPPAMIGCDPGDVVDLDGTASSSGTGVTYNWTADMGGALAGANGVNFTQAGAPGRYILTVTQSNASGLTCIARDTVEVQQQVVVLGTPTFTQAETNVCGGTTHTYTISPVTGAIGYDWTVPAGATMTGSGTSIDVTYPTTAGSGTVCVTALGNCGDSPPACVPVTINAIPTSDFTVDSPICITESSTITYTGTGSPFANYTWNFNGGMPASVTGAGPHTITWDSPGPKNVTLTVEENGCMSTVTTQIVQVDAELAEPVISCTSTTTSVSFSWNPIPGANDYTITVTPGGTSTQAGTTFDVTGLMPGDAVDITVVANGSTDCGPSTASSNCVAQNCPPVALNIAPVADICRDATTGAVTLTAAPDDGGAGTFTWSGPGVTGMTFDPQSANVGVNTIALQYTVGTCDYTESIDIMVNNVPDPSFTVSGPICGDTETATVSYTGSASAAATYTWDFGVGTPDAGASGAGPYEVSYTGSPGVQTISLIVEENGCISPASTETVQVDETLAPPVINCLFSSSTGVEIGWDAVTGATSYTVNTSLPSTVDMIAQTITVDGMTPGQDVDVTITAEGTTACGPSSASLTCTANDCPMITVDITPIDPICDNGNAPTVTLEATVTGATINGVYTWTGPGVSQPDIFDPNSGAINPGTVTIGVNYQEGTCSYSNSIDVTILPQPASDFTAVSPICIDETSTVTYTGGADATATYNWDLGSGTAVSGSGTGPYEVSWATAGTYDIILEVTEDNCTSEPTTVSVQVDDPLPLPIINCVSDQNTIDFSWDVVPGALGYDVELISGTAGVFDGSLNYNVTGLSPGDEVTIAVTVNGTTDCGPVSDTLNCVAQNCPDYLLAMPNIGPFCFNDPSNMGAIDLDTVITITNMAGDDLIDSVALVWDDASGNQTAYITAGGQFRPSAVPNAGAIPVGVTVEYPIGSGCFQPFSTTVQINPKPVNTVVMPTEICFTDGITVSLGSTPNDPAATFAWDFGSANASGTGAGPYDLIWDAIPSGGSETVSVVVTELGCDSDPATATIRVDTTLERLNINCDALMTGNQSIGFEWNDVGGDAPVIQVLNSNISPLPTPTSQTNTSVFFGGLNPQDDITLIVTVDDGATVCPPVADTLNCIAKQCPPTRITINPITDNCIPPTGVTPIQLTLTFENDPANGTDMGMWSGDVGSSYIDPDNGMFTPDQEGTYYIQYDYSHDGCSYDTSIIIQMYETPTADFTATDVCELFDTEIEYTGDAEAGAVFTWDFGGGDAPAGFDPRDPQTVTWPGDGNYDIILSIDNNGCAATPVTQSVQVDPDYEDIMLECDPNIDATTSSVAFSWNPDPTVTQYDIHYFYGGNRTDLPLQNITSYLVDGLPIGDINVPAGVNFYVTTSGNTSCPVKRDTVLCSKLICPDSPIDVTPIDDGCIDALSQTVTYQLDLPPFTLPGYASFQGDGVWTVTGRGVSSDEFDPNTAGVGVHTISFNYIEQGCEYSDSYDVEVFALPNVDAGGDKVITCKDTSAQIGSDFNSPTYTFEWVYNGDVIGNNQFETVTGDGTYTLNVTDQNGCMNSDEVLVDASLTNPEIDAELNNITCFGRRDGAITVNGMTGGAPPFEYSFNGSPFSSTTFWSNLGPGEYTIIGQDDNGCTSEISFEIIEPDELTVEIVIVAGENPVPFGDSINLEAVTNYAPDLLSSISWTPVESFPICDETNITNCLSAWVTPSGQTVYSVRIENLNGCVADDVIPVVGIKDHPIYIPSGFSPNNNDGVNDYFGLYADPKIVTNIKSFLIFNRWGELMFENYNIQPTLNNEIDPTNGWDGSFKGKTLNSGVYVYMFEVEFFDGLVEIFKGDITIK